jgi:hypothetical protein
MRFHYLARARAAIAGDSMDWLMRSLGVLEAAKSARSTARTLDRKNRQFLAKPGRCVVL